MLRSARKDTYQSKNYEQISNCSIPNRRRSREQLLTPNSTFKIHVALFPTAVSLCANAATRMGDILLFFKIFVHKKVFKLLTNISFCSYLFIYISQFFVKFHKEHVRIIIFFTDISHRTIIIVFTS